MTVQRKLILRIIRTAEEHMTADEIYRKAKAEMPSIAMGTVYRNLSLMVDAGEILRLSVPGKPDRFDKGQKKHDHLICDVCEKMKDVLIPGLSDAIEYQTGEKILTYDLTIRYICDACREKAQTRKR